MQKNYEKWLGSSRKRFAQSNTPSPLNGQPTKFWGSNPSRNSQKRITKFLHIQTLWQKYRGVGDELLERWELEVIKVCLSKMPLACHKIASNNAPLFQLHAKFTENCGQFIRSTQAKRLKLLSIRENQSLANQAAAARSDVIKRIHFPDSSALNWVSTWHKLFQHIT